MSKKERAVIYPYDIELAPVVRHSGLLEAFDIAGLASPKGWGMENRDAGCADKGSILKTYIYSDFKGLLDTCDTVIFSRPYNTIDRKRLVHPKIVYAAEAKKNIVCIMDMDEEAQGEVSRLCEKEGVYFKYYGYGGITGDFEVERENLNEINTPVIFVLGTAERTHKFEIQLALREAMLDMGYSVSQIGSRSYCELLGFHSFPSFMYSCSIPESRKIVLFNRFIKSIENRENADVIIIGIPGGIMPFNKAFTNRFGITAYEVCNAITPDAVVLSSLYEDYKPEYFENISSSIKYKLGLEVDCHNISNIKVDWNNSREQMAYITLDSKFIDEKNRGFHELNMPVYNVLNAEDSKNMAHSLVDKLSEYSKAQSV